MKTGYPLELLVQKVALSKGYFCEKSPIYSDIESGVAREVDLAAYKHGIATDEYFYDIQLLFECKKSEKPLLVLCNSNSLKERYEHYWGHEVVSDDGPHVGFFGYSHLHTLTREERILRIGRFSERVYCGYSVVPAFSTSDENIYKGIMGLAKANEHYRKQYYEFYKEVRSEEQAYMVDANPFQLLIPVLIVDAPLYYVYLADDGETNIEETNWASLLIRLPWVLNTSDEERMCNIQLVRKEALNEFLDAVEAFHIYISRPEIVSPALISIERESIQT